MFKKKLSYIRTMFSSTLPKNVGEERNPNLFKRKLKQFLIEKQFYSIILSVWTNNI